MFEARNVFQKADKPQVASVNSDDVRDIILDAALETGCHVLDGGSLLH